MVETKQNNPIAVFEEWYNFAMEKQGIESASSMALATATKEGIPSVRILLLKGFDEEGFRFFTNLGSRKAKELNENPHAALCFYWEAIERQVRIEGSVQRVTEKQADVYFASRHRGSQIGAWASKQSFVMEDDNNLKERVSTITEQFSSQVMIPRPPFWSGFCLKPEKIEFWQEGKFRLHTRILYTKSSGSWLQERLYP